MDGRQMRTFWGVITAASLALLVGCSSPASQGAEAAPIPQTDLSVLRGGPAMADYMLWDSPAKLLPEAPVVLSGTIDGIEAGRIYASKEPGGGDARVHTARPLAPIP